MENKSAEQHNKEMPEIAIHCMDHFFVRYHILPVLRSYDIMWESVLYTY